MHQHLPKRHPLNRSAVNLAASWAVEALEDRVLLSGNVFSISKVPVYTPTSASLADVKHGPLANAGANLATLYNQFKKFVRNGGARSNFSSAIEKSVDTRDNEVAVTIRTRATMAATTTAIHQMGGELLGRSSAYSAVQAWIPISQLSALAQAGFVANVNPVYKEQLNTQGIAPNQADQGENADAARITFGLDGSGIKVGVISDSVNSVGKGLTDSVNSGDLPNDVQIVGNDTRGFGDTDEGRAMLELIHDIAPGAALAFARATNTQLGFAQAVVALQRAGCNVIVDDVGFTDEPAFQSGVIDQAITDAVENHNVTYLSAAGNSSSGGFLTDAHFVTDINHRILLDFDPSDAVDTRMRVTVNGSADINLQWDNPFNGIVGAADVDLDITFYDPNSGGIVAQSNDANLATGEPIDVLSGGVPPGTYDIEVSVADIAKGASLPTMIRINSQQIPGELPPLSNFEYAGIESTTTGHNAGQDTISVAAVPFYLAPPFNGSTTVSNDPFSSFGPVVSVFKGSGERRNKPLTLQKPDISGIDGVDTSFFGDSHLNSKDKDTLPNFAGTSAAAPNVAAVVALMLQANPDATPAEVKAALISSAEHNPVNNQKPGTFNPQSGFGLIDGLQAVHDLVPGTVVADIGRIVPDSVSRGVNQITIDFSEPIAGFDLHDLSLTRGKGSTTNLLAGAAVKLKSDDDQHFILSGLSSITMRRGTYTLHFDPNQVFDENGEPALAGFTSFFVSGKPTDFTAIPVSPSEIDLSWIDNTPSETGFVVYRALDSSFTKGLRTFQVKAGVTHFKDLSVESSTQYFYKIKAITNDGAPSPTSTSQGAVSLADNEVIVDNRTTNGVAINGAWSFIIDSPDSFGGDYLAASAKGAKSVVFTPLIPSDGHYYVYVHAITGKTNASNAPVDLLRDGSVKKTVSLDERTAGWVLLGQFDLPEGRHVAVQIRNTDANGTVIADAVRFQRISGGVINAVAATNPNLFSSKKVKKTSDDLVV